MCVSSCQEIRAGRSEKCGRPVAVVLGSLQPALKGIAVFDETARTGRFDAHGDQANARGAGLVRVAVNNFYSDGHSSLTIIDLESPGGEIDDWFAEVVFPHTGDGHGVEHPDLATVYEAEIVDAEDPTLIGRRCQWDG
jgi:hypothetical protein